MRFTYILPALLTVLIFSACDKDDKDCWDKGKCDFCDDKDWDFLGEKDNDKSTDWDDDKNADWDDKDTYNNSEDDLIGNDDDKHCGNEIEEIVVEPLVLDESCGCYVEGIIKYVEDDETIAMVKYHDSECEGKATKILCYDGDCEHKKAECCTFYQECGDEGWTK